MIQVKDLLAPVPGELRQGKDLRNPSSALLSDLKSAWTAAWRNNNPHDWETVERDAATILIRHSKDTQVAAWLVEALGNTWAFAGIAAGGSLIAGMAEGFQNTLYPGPEPDEPEVTPASAWLEPLSRLGGNDNGRLLPVVRRIALFTLEDGTSFSIIDCQRSKSWSAFRAEERADRLKKMASNEARAAFEKSAEGRQWDTVGQEVKARSSGMLAALSMDVAAALEAWHDAVKKIEAVAGEGKFNCRALIEILESVQRIAMELAPPEANPAAVPTPGESAAPAAIQSSVVAAVGPPQRPDNREDALRQLAELTAFFRRTEPHSPVAFTLDEALRRARLSWPDWLAEVVPDRQQREGILTRLGIRPDDASG